MARKEPAGEIYTASEDDNVLVQGVSGDQNAIGYFGYAYYEENQDSLKLVGIDDGDATNGEGCVAPSEETVVDTTYQPLARPIFIYVKQDALERPEVPFVDFYLNTANKDLVSETGCVALPDGVYEKAQRWVTDQKTGTAFQGSTVGVKLEEAL